jgi:hypothetical protein
MREFKATISVSVTQPNLAMPQGMTCVKPKPLNTWLWPTMLEALRVRPPVNHGRCFPFDDETIAPASPIRQPERFHCAHPLR